MAPVAPFIAADRSVQRCSRETVTLIVPACVARLHLWFHAAVAADGASNVSQPWEARTLQVLI